ncbi:MAG: alpha/beta fold hydrolase [Candidatus Thorarchaeota archaeon]
MKEDIQIPFEPQNLFATVWSPDHEMESIGVIVAIHGVGSSGSREYYYYGPYMAQRGWTVIAYDCPGFGHWQPKDKRARKEHVKMVSSSVHAALLKAREIVPVGPLVLTGLSMGGGILVKYVTNYAKTPSRYNPPMPKYSMKIKSLVDTPAPELSALVGIVPAIGVSIPRGMSIVLKILGTVVPNRMINLFEQMASAEGMSEEQVKTMMDEMATNYDEPPDDGYGIELLTFGFLKDYIGMLNETGLSSKSYNNWPTDVPTIFLTGEEDPVVKADDVKAYFDRIPEMTKEFHCYAGCSHPLQFHKKREEYFEDIHQFLISNAL